MREASQGSDVLLGHVGVGGGVVKVVMLGHSVDLLVNFRAVVVTELTSAANSVAHVGRVPASDATNSSPTSMGLLLQVLHAVTLDDSSNSLTLGDSDHVDVLVLLEDLIDAHFLFEQALREVDLLLSVTAVDLDFEDVVLLLAEVELVELGVGDHTHDLAILDDALELSLDVGSFLVLRGVLGEGLLLRVHPVFVETAKSVFGQLRGPDGGEGAEAAGSLDVADDAHNHDGRGFDYGDCFDDFLLVQLGAGSLHGTKDVCHASLESGESCEVRLLRRIIFGEGSDSASVMLGALARGEAQMAVTRRLVFSVGHV